jgi:peroxiredoxin Q/BCP
LAQLRRDYRKFAKMDTEIVSIAPEDLETVRRYWRKERLPFVGLADPEHKVADRYGQAVRLIKLGRLPLQLIIDQTGTVRYRHDASSMSDIPSNAAILEEISQADLLG